MALPYVFADSPTPGQVWTLATLAAPLTAGASSLSASGAAPASLQANPGQFDISIDNEILTIDASTASGSTWTILARGVGQGGSGSAHSSGASISHVVTAEAINSIRQQVPVTTQAANYTLQLADAGTTIEMTGSNRTLTVPPNSAVAFPVGTVIDITRTNGLITIAAGSGVTISADSQIFKIVQQWKTVRLRKRATNTWVLSGTIPGPASSYLGGSGSGVVPNGAVWARIILIGGGGGGGGGATAPTGTPAGGGSGAGGAQRREELVSMTGGAAYTYSVGQAGAGGFGGAPPSNPGSDGQPGTATTITISGYTFTAAGGQQGLGGQVSPGSPQTGGLDGLGNSGGGQGSQGDGANFATAGAPGSGNPWGPQQGVVPSGGGGGASGDPGSGTWLGGQSGNIGGYTDTNLPGEAGADFGSPVEQGTVPGDNLRQYGAGAAGAAGSVSDGGWSGASGNQGNPGTLEIEWVYAN